MPPQHGKTETATKRFPVWYLGRHPNRRVILTAYNDPLAWEFSRDARAIFREYGRELWGLSLSGESSSVALWKIAGHRGGMAAAGVGGALTGRGAWLAIIDDPIKNWKEAYSPTYREDLWQWYKAVLRPRVHPAGAIVLIMTRWHHDDLAGRLIKLADTGGERWEVLRLPALAEEQDPLGRKPGEPLWPEHGYTLEWYLETRETSASQIWFAQYQQRPTAEEGGLFKREHFRYFRREGDYYILIRPEGEERVSVRRCWVFQTCDPAASTSSSADWFVLATWAVTPKRSLLLIDLVRLRLEGPDQPALIKDAYDRFHPVLQGIEDKSIGLPLYQALRRKGLPVIRLKAETDKYVRALPVSARFKAGEVFLPISAPWLADYEDELLQFPRGEHDDQVDVTSYAEIILAQYGDEYGGGGEVSARIL